MVLAFLFALFLYWACLAIIFLCEQSRTKLESKASPTVGAAQHARSVLSNARCDARSGDAMEVSDDESEASSIDSKEAAQLESLATVYESTLSPVAYSPLPSRRDCKDSGNSSEIDDDSRSETHAGSHHDGEGAAKIDSEIHSEPRSKATGRGDRVTSSHTTRRRRP